MHGTQIRTDSITQRPGDRTDFVVKLLLAGVLITAQPLSAGEIFYLSLPGMCSAHDAALEESDAMVLTRRSVGNHYFECSFTKTIDAALDKGEWIETGARCANETDSWSAEFEIVPVENGTLNLFQKRGGLAPVRFHRCGS
jgi:hypothetical protein